MGALEAGHTVTNSMSGDGPDELNFDTILSFLNLYDLGIDILCNEPLNLRLYEAVGARNYVRCSF